MLPYSLLSTSKSTRTRPWEVKVPWRQDSGQGTFVRQVSKSSELPKSGSITTLWNSGDYYAVAFLNPFGVWVMDVPTDLQVGI